MLPSWKIYIQSYTIYLKLERSLSEHSIEAYVNDVRKLAELSQVIEGGISPEKVSLKEIEHLLTTIHDLGLGEKSQARILSGLRSFFKFLMIENVIDASPMELVEGPKLSKKMPSVLDPFEIQAILSQILDHVS